MRRFTILLAALFPALPGLTEGVGLAQELPNTPCTAAPRSEEQPTTDDITSADDLLAHLEDADRDLAALTADIRYDRTFELAGDRQVRIGRLVYESDLAVDPPARRFAIEFDHLVLGDRMTSDPKSYVFDGEWLVERLHTDKVMIKRQIVPPGERFDPLRIGEGPLPIPIGQKREEILARYSAELRPVSESLAPDPDMDERERAEARELAEFVGGSWQVRLSPRPEFAEADEFEEIRLWYARTGEGGGRLLPILARTVNRAGDVSVVQLINIEVNRPVPARIFDVGVPRDWHVEIRAWEGEVRRR